jgi:hypothetical protein
VGEGNLVTDTAKPEDPAPLCRQDAEYFAARLAAENKERAHD